MLVLEPIFEADLEPEQHAYRPEHNVQNAVRQVERLLRTGHTEVVDADLSGYFDSIPHAELMKSVSLLAAARECAIIAEPVQPFRDWSIAALALSSSFSFPSILCKRASLQVI